MNYLSEALIQLAPGEQFSINGDNITWHTNGSHPTQEQIDAKVSELTVYYSLDNLRFERNRMLAESDWRVIRATETGVAMSNEWKTYRQALRDITQHYQNLDDVVWPTEPS